MTRCDRCLAETLSTIMSMFDQDMICPACKGVEMKHPDYETVREAEREAVKGGNYNWMGPGWPGKDGRL